MSGALHDPSRQCETEVEFHDLLVGPHLLTGSVHVTYDVTPSYRDEGDPPRRVPDLFEIIALGEVRIDAMALASAPDDDLEGWGWIPFGDPREAAVIAALEASADILAEISDAHRDD